MSVKHTVLVDNQGVPAFCHVPGKPGQPGHSVCSLQQSCDIETLRLLADVAKAVVNHLRLCAGMPVCLHLP